MLLKWLCSSLIGMILASVSLWVADTGKGNDIEWMTDYEKALARAKEFEKPVLIDFWASWCGPCKEMDRTVWPDPKVTAGMRKFIAISIDVDRQRWVASKYAVTSYPTVLFADPWGNEISRRVGLVPAGDLVSLLNAFPASFSGVAPWLGVLEKDGKNSEALLGLGDVYHKLGALDLSNRYFERALKTAGVKQDVQKKEAALLGLGLNNLKMQKYKEARKTFEACLKEVPTGSRCAHAYLGLVTAQLGQGKVGEAEKTFAALQAKYPDSPATQQAAKNIQSIKNSPP